MVGLEDDYATKGFLYPEIQEVGVVISNGVEMSVGCMREPSGSECIRNVLGVPTFLSENLFFHN